MSSLFDSHTHIQFPLYDADREGVIRRAREAGVKMLCVATQAASSQAAVDLAKKYPGEIWAAAGFHPSHLRAPDAFLDGTVGVPAGAGWYHDKNEQVSIEQEKFDAKKLLEIAKQPEVVAIGECGLDYFRLDKNETIINKEKGDQREAFIAQIELAKKVQKPLMLHLRPSKGTGDAYEDALRIISNFQLPISKISHFFVGSLAIAKKMLEAGFSFTFGGVTTFVRDYDEVIKYLPVENILLETDAPYVAPAPYRGKRNEPSYILETARKIAELKGVSFDELAEKTFANSLRIFQIRI
ncbi:MAG: TatD family hydrolase [bacterium]|nr:TatD family hydrolase [bacterium]